MSRPKEICAYKGICTQKGAVSALERRQHEHAARYVLCYGGGRMGMWVLMTDLMSSPTPTTSSTLRPCTRNNHKFSRSLWYSTTLLHSNIHTRTHTHTHTCLYEKANPPLRMGDRRCVRRTSVVWRHVGAHGHTLWRRVGARVAAYVGVLRDVGEHVAAYAGVMGDVGARVATYLHRSVPAHVSPPSDPIFQAFFQS